MVYPHEKYKLPIDLQLIYTCAGPLIDANIMNSV